MRKAMFMGLICLTATGYAATPPATGAESPPSNQVASLAQQLPTQTVEDPTILLVSNLGSALGHVALSDQAHVNKGFIDEAQRGSFKAASALSSVGESDIKPDQQAIDGLFRDAVKDNNQGLLEYVLKAPELSLWPSAKLMDKTRRTLLAAGNIRWAGMIHLAEREILIKRQARDIKCFKEAAKRGAFPDATQEFNRHFEEANPSYQQALDDLFRDADEHNNQGLLEYVLREPELPQKPSVEVIDKALHDLLAAKNIVKAKKIYDAASKRLIRAKLFVPGSHHHSFFSAFMGGYLGFARSLLTPEICGVLCNMQAIDLLLSNVISLYKDSSPPTTAMINRRLGILEALLNPEINPVQTSQESADNALKAFIKCNHAYATVLLRWKTFSRATLEIALSGVDIGNPSGAAIKAQLQAALAAALDDDAAGGVSAAGH